MNKISYEQWQQMRQDEKDSTPEEMLPEISPEKLENSLTRAVCKRMDGVIGWETTQTVPNGSNTRWFPEFQQKEVRGQKIWYRFDPICGLYSMNLSETEPTMEEEPIGSYGMQWMHFMETQHPQLVELMELRNQYLTVARSVDKAAWEYRELLDSQYEQQNPRPTDFNQTVAWEQARMFFSDSAVMREKVLIPVTTP